ncbi:MAG TPA: chromosome segregation protein ScpA [Kiritimatiellae bacterium]|nr:chromosome segregation protein ScpA [Kiritimatiellia bacterium]
MSARGEYRVRLEVFEGPLDLLLYLIRKNEVDIYDIPIEEITRQYMEYLDLMRMLDLNIAGEFLVMAATLMVIKSRMLLPPEERDEDEEEEDPRWELVRQLLEYKKFKEAAGYLEQREAQQENVFTPEEPGTLPPPDPSLSLAGVNIFDLITVFNKALKRLPREDLREVFGETFTVADKLEELVQLTAKRRRLSLSSLFDRMRSRVEMVCTFLALLELMRVKQVRAIQERPFGEILIEGVA